MNILPHKSWHVWTQKNKDKVHEDEKQEKEKEEKKRKRQEEYEQDKRLTILRERAAKRSKSDDDNSAEERTDVKMEENTELKHVNLFETYDIFAAPSGPSSKADLLANPEYKAEKKKKKKKKIT